MASLGSAVVLHGPPHPPGPRRSMFDHPKPRLARKNSRGPWAGFHVESSGFQGSPDSRDSHPRAEAATFFDRSLGPKARGHPGILWLTFSLHWRPGLWALRNFYPNYFGYHWPALSKPGRRRCGLKGSTPFVQRFLLSLCVWKRPSYLILGFFGFHAPRNCLESISKRRQNRVTWIKKNEKKKITAV